jgi:membrane associated rhomboid family serine protease
MRRPPSILRAGHYPATAGTMILALAASIAAWRQVDLSPLLQDATAAHGQLWRLITSALLHANPIHLALNLAFLWTFGTPIEQRFGPAKTFALFGFLALGSGAAEYALFDGGCGLSGIGYGLFALLWVLGRRDPQNYGDDLPGPAVSATLVGGFFLCIGLTFSGVFPVANVAHAAGAALGAVLGFSMTVMHLHRNHAQALVATVTVAFVTCATIARPFVNLSPRRGQEEAYLGYQALLREDDRTAAWWFRDATTARPTNADYWFNRGVAEARLKHAAAALAAYERAAALSPQNPTYQTALAEMKTYTEQTARVLSR